MSCHCGCPEHSLHRLLFHSRRRWLALLFWMILLAGVPAGLASMVWDPLGPPVLLAALLAETVWVLRRV
jgi:membrane protein required for beta-lactamase induction